MYRGGGAGLRNIPKKNISFGGFPYMFVIQETQVDITSTQILSLTVTSYNIQWYHLCIEYDCVEKMKQYFMSGY